MHCKSCFSLYKFVNFFLSILTLIFLTFHFPIWYCPIFNDPCFLILEMLPCSDSILQLTLCDLLTNLASVCVAHSASSIRNSLCLWSSGNLPSIFTANLRPHPEYRTGLAADLGIIMPFAAESSAIACGVRGKFSFVNFKWFLVLDSILISNAWHLIKLWRHLSVWTEVHRPIVTHPTYWPQPINPILCHVCLSGLAIQPN